MVGLRYVSAWYGHYLRPEGFREPMRHFGKDGCALDPYQDFERAFYGREGLGVWMEVLVHRGLNAEPGLAVAEHSLSEFGRDRFVAPGSRTSFESRRGIG